MNLHTRIEKNINMSKQIKALAGVCIFFSFCISFGSDIILEKQDGIATKIVWIISMIVTIVLFFKDSYYVKKNKAYEFEIYKLDVEDLENKKKVAEIRKEALPDFVLNRKIDMPKEEVSLPIIYYSIMLVLDIIIRIKWIH